MSVDDHILASRANRVLHFILILLLLILLRVWHLAVIQREARKVQAFEPQRKTSIERVERGTIRDRFDLPCAVNEIHYCASICFAPIRSIPSLLYETDQKGERRRRHPRKEYVAELAALLGRELSLDPLEVEDTIWARAALFPHLPFVVKGGLSEEEYYRLRALERLWPGVQTEKAYRRVYPHGKTGASLIGYLGAIDEKRYDQIAGEIEELRSFLKARERGELAVLPKGFDDPVAARRRLKELEEKAYGMQDCVGKAGIEALFDEQLRGRCGRRLFEVDAKGHRLRELPGSCDPTAGERVILSLSLELQAYAEELLAQHETLHASSSPWIKGGAIVALLPDTGEVLALASHPRFDPNDFIATKGARAAEGRSVAGRKPAQDVSKAAQGGSSQQWAVRRWLEGMAYIGEIWDGKRPLERELYAAARGGFFLEEQPLTWEHYLELILAPAGATRKLLEGMTSVEAALTFQRAAKGAPPESDEERLAWDLCRLVVREEELSPALVALFGRQSLGHFRAMTQAKIAAQETVKEATRRLFHRLDFRDWRESSFSAFLAERREEERAQQRYTRPYTDYLERAEREHFARFWEQYGDYLLELYLRGSPSCTPPDTPHLPTYLDQLSHLPRGAEVELLRQHVGALPSPLLHAYLRAMHAFRELDQPLLQRYRGLRSDRGRQLASHLAAAFYPSTGFSYGRSYAYRHSLPQGSVFKLVTAYEALRQRYGRERDLNPLTLVDDMQLSTGHLGYTLGGEQIPRFYKGGMLPRGHAHIGKIDLAGALEQSSNLYFAYLAGEVLREPNDLLEAAKSFGFGSKTGIDLPGEYAGSLPNDLTYNRTGLYSFAIGHHTLTTTPLQTAMMVAALANGGALLKPQIVSLLAGKGAEEIEQPFRPLLDYPFKEPLSLIGIPFPLFSQLHAAPLQPHIALGQREVRRTLFLPPPLQQLLLEAMQRVVSGSKGSARPRLLTRLAEPHWLPDYVDLRQEFIGKTGTAEVLHQSYIDPHLPAQLHKHVWFAGISYPKGALFREPELVVVVFLRFGEAGRDAAPIAAQIVKKWREIIARHGGRGAFTASPPDTRGRRWQSKSAEVARLERSP